MSSVPITINSEIKFPENEFDYEGLSNFSLNKF